MTMTLHILLMMTACCWFNISFPVLWSILFGTFIAMIMIVVGLVMFIKAKLLE